MKSSTLKRVFICIGLLLVGGIGGYLVANHQFHKRVIQESFFGRPFMMDPWVYDTMGNFRHREKDMENMFDDLEKEFFEDNKRVNEDFRDEEFENLDKLGNTSGDSQSNGSFHYYKKTNNNGKKSSYNVEGKRNDGSDGGKIVMSGTNENGKDFSYSGTFKDGKSEGVLIDEDGNSKNLNLDEIDIEKIYDDSNNVSE